MTELLDQLARLLPDGAVVPANELTERATSYWDSSPTEAKALLSPESTQQVSDVMRLCHDAGQSVVVQASLN